MACIVYRDIAGALAFVCVREPLAYACKAYLRRVGLPAVAVIRKRGFRAPASKEFPCTVEIEGFD